MPASQRIHGSGWHGAIRDFAAARKPFLGICLGMQLLAEQGAEGGDSPGLALIPGTVQRIPASGLRIPHVGWNEVKPQCEHPLFADIKPGRDFYFVHSFHFIAADQSHVLAVTDYGQPLCAAVAQGNVVGTQFHPEKSQRNGLALLEAFLDWDGQV